MRSMVKQGIFTAVLCLTGLAAPALAGDVGDFYKGKRLSVYVGSAAGGGYDSYARHVARHIGRVVPGNPGTVVQNMPGGGGIKVVNYLYAVAPKEGTALGIVQRNLPTAPLIEARNDNAIYDSAKFNWLGSLNTETGVIISSTSAPHKTMEDLFKTELIVGGSGPTSDFLPLFLNNVIGTKFKIVQGYQGSVDAYLAVERGEVQGRVSGGWTSDRLIVEPWYKDGKVRYLAVVSLKPSPYFPDIPLVTEYAKTEEQKQVMELILAGQLWGRPFVAPPGVPTERVAALRQALMALTKDQEFVAEAKKLKLDLEPITGEEMETILKRVYATEPQYVEAARKAISADTQ